MPANIESSVFRQVRGDDKLSDGLLAQVVALVERSPTWSRLFADFEGNDGVIAYCSSGTNYFRAEAAGADLVPTVYVADVYSGPDADVDAFASVACHEMAHYMSYYHSKFNPNEMETSDEAAVAAVWDEARAHTLEYVVQEEINATGGPKVDWMKPGQKKAIAPRRALLKCDGARTLASIDAVLQAGAPALWRWAALYTGPNPADPCYLQSYKNAWFDTAEAYAREHTDYVLKEKRCKIPVKSLKVTRAPDGSIRTITYGAAATRVEYDWVEDVQDLVELRFS